MHLTLLGKHAKIHRKISTEGTVHTITVHPVVQSPNDRKITYLEICAISTSIFVHPARLYKCVLQYSLYCMTLLKICAIVFYLKMCASFHSWDIRSLGILLILLLQISLSSQLILSAHSTFSRLSLGMPLTLLSKTLLEKMCV